MPVFAVLRTAVVATVLGAAVLALPGARPASAADPLPNRPDFRLPFDCGATAVIQTYYGHNPDDKKMDIRVQGQPTGARIRAAADGYVHQSFSPGGIEIRHGNGWFTTYMHMSSYVPVGTTVRAGDVIGTMGNVGSPDYHLHHEQLYAPGLNDAGTQHIVHPLIQGEGPLVLSPERPLTRVSTNCGGGAPSRVDVDTTGDAPGYDVPGGAQTGVLRAGTNYVFCRSWGPEVREGASFNHWWLRTDLDVGPANQWVSAIHLTRWGNDEARDNGGRQIVDCNEPYGAIGDKWRALGGVASPVGPPKLPELSTQLGGRFQEFWNGMVIWHADTGAHPVYGAILGHFRSFGSESRWGFPTMDEAGAANGGRFQYMQRGLFLWSAATGAHVVHGAILDAFAANGREASLGYPTSDEIPHPDGVGVYQTYQNATIHWTAQRGAWIVR